MFKALLTVAALAAPAALATAQTAQPRSGQWVLEVAPGGCIVHAASPSGTVISIWAAAGQSDLSFLVQNRSWNTLQDGSRYDLQVSFDDKGAFPVKATAKTNLDSDGPGLTFAVSPAGAVGGAGFLEQFAAAGGMHITRDGARVDTLSLTNTGTAMPSLAKCLRQVWTAGADAPAEGNATGGTVITASEDALPI